MTTVQPHCTTTAQMTLRYVALVAAACVCAADASAANTYKQPTPAAEEINNKSDGAFDASSSGDKSDLAPAASAYIHGGYGGGTSNWIGYNGYNGIGYSGIDGYQGYSSGVGSGYGLGYSGNYDGYSGYGGNTGGTYRGNYGGHGGNYGVSGGNYGGYGGYRSGHGGYGGYGGNGGLSSYTGYNNPNYYGSNTLGYGYNNRATHSGYYYGNSGGRGNIFYDSITPSLVTGYRGYTRR